MAKTTDRLTIKGEDYMVQDSALKSAINGLQDWMPVNFTIDDIYYTRNGYSNQNSSYESCEIEYDGSQIRITSACNSAAVAAVYFNGTPSPSTCIGFEDIEYPASYGTLVLTDHVLTVPAGTTKIVINNRLAEKTLSVSKYTIEYTNYRIDSLETSTESLYGYARIDVDTTVGYYGKAGYYNSGNQYENFVFDATPSDKIKVTTNANSAAPIAVYFNGNPSNTTCLGYEHADYPANYGTLSVKEFELTIPAGTTKIAINNRPGSGFIKVFKYSDEYLNNRISRLENYNCDKILYIGDSITYQNIWIPYFEGILNPTKSVNIGVVGAWMRDKEGTVYNGNPTSSDSTNNVIGNQVEKIIRGKDTDSPYYSEVSDYADFDVIMISAGTNDSDYEAINTIESQFIVNGSVVSVDSADRKTFAGAMRYAYEKLHALYPNAQIFFCTPIQEWSGGESYESISAKGSLEKAICHRMSIDCIDTAQCGICNVLNTVNTGSVDFADGIHPNATGGKKIGRFNAKEVINRRWLVN